MKQMPVNNTKMARTLLTGLILDLGAYAKAYNILSNPLVQGTISVLRLEVIAIPNCEGEDDEKISQEIGERNLKLRSQKWGSPISCERCLLTYNLEGLTSAWLLNGKLLRPMVYEKKLLEDSNGNPVGVLLAPQSEGHGWILIPKEKDIIEIIREVNENTSTNF